MKQNHILGRLDPLSKVYVVFHSLILSFFHHHAIPIQVLLHKVPKLKRKKIKLVGMKVHLHICLR